MAEYKVVDAEKLDAELKSLADKIREKGGTTEELDFYEGDFTNAVGAIESGGGGTEENVNGLILSDFTGNYNKPKVADLRSFWPDKPNNISYIGMFSYMLQNDNAVTGFYTDIHTVYLPDWITCFSGNMFQNCGNLTNLYGDTSNVTIIGGQAFGGCVKLTEFPYMPKLQQISASAFYNCKGLTEIKIYNTLNSFSSGAFSACTNITDIYVPWAEGTVGGAPWGATNATIHYNTTYDENHNPTV